MTILLLADSLLQSKNCRYALDLFFGLVILFFVGLRVRVGGDWDSYIRIFNSYITDSAATNFEPAFEFILQIMTYFDHSVSYQIFNVYYIGLFLFFLYCFVYNLETVKISVVQISWCVFPIFIFLLTTGYIRQAVASVFILPIFCQSHRGKYIRALLWVFVAAIFHKSALGLFLLPGLYFLYGRILFFKAMIARQKIIVAILLLVLCLIIVCLFSVYMHLILSYTDGQLVSKGLAIRMGYFLILVSPVLWLRRSTFFSLNRRYLLLIMLVLLFFTALCYNYSTLVDRYLLYFYLPAAVLTIKSLSPYNKANKALVLYYCGMLVVNIVYTFFWLKYSYYGNTKWIPFCHSVLGCYK